MKTVSISIERWLTIPEAVDLANKLFPDLFPIRDQSDRDLLWDRFRKSAAKGFIAARRGDRSWELEYDSFCEYMQRRVAEAKGTDQASMRRSAILESVANYDGIGRDDIAAATDIPASTVHRYLVKLEKAKQVYRTGDQKNGFMWYIN